MVHTLDFFPEYELPTSLCHLDRLNLYHANHNLCKLKCSLECPISTVIIYNYKHDTCIQNA